MLLLLLCWSFAPLRGIYYIRHTFGGWERGKKSMRMLPLALPVAATIVIVVVALYRVINKNLGITFNRIVYLVCWFFNNTKPIEFNKGLSSWCYCCFNSPLHHWSVNFMHNFTKFLHLTSHFTEREISFTRNWSLLKLSDAWWFHRIQLISWYNVNIQRKKRIPHLMTLNRYMR